MYWWYWSILMHHKKLFLKKRVSELFPIAQDFFLSLGNTNGKTEHAIFSLSFDSLVFTLSMAGTNINPVAQIGMLGWSLDSFFSLTYTLLFTRKCCHFSFHLPLGSTSLYPHHLKLLQHYFLNGTIVSQTTFGPV